MPNKIAVDHTGTVHGTFFVTGPTSVKRVWNMRCEKGHTTKRRIDILLRTMPEKIVCLDCKQATKTPAPIKPIGEVFVLTHETKAALNILTQSLGLALKALAEIARTTA